MTRSRTAWWLKALTRRLFRPAAARQRRRSCRLYLEALEDRITPNAYVVNVATDTSGSPAGSGSGTSGDLRYVLNQAIDDKQADTITFAPALAGQTITLSKSLVTAPSGFTNPYGQTAFIVGASDNITIDGAAARGLTLSGNSATRPFVVAGGGKLTLANLTLSDGSSTGGNGSNGSGNSYFASAGGGGGAGLGGGVLVDGSTFTASGCTFVNNQARGGAGGTGFAGGFTSLNARGGHGGALGAAFVDLPGSGHNVFFGGGRGGGDSGGSGGGFSIGASYGGFGGGGGGGGDPNAKLTRQHGPGNGGFGGGGGGGGTNITQRATGQHVQLQQAGKGGNGGGGGNGGSLAAS
jgi:hypothetical protein